MLIFSKSQLIRYCTVIWICFLSKNAWNDNTIWRFSWNFIHSYLFQEISERKRKFQLFDFDRKTITKSRNLSYHNGTFVNKFTKPCHFTDERNELGFWTCIISYFMYFFTLMGFHEIICNQYYRFFISYGVLRFQSVKEKYSNHEKLLLRTSKSAGARGNVQNFSGCQAPVTPVLTQACYIIGSK